MAAALIRSLILLLTIVLWSRISAQPNLSQTPPRGWNSYDSFSWIVSEEEFLANADVVSKYLKDSGYEYVVVDFLWYRRNVEGASVTSPGFDLIDEWGRLVPDPVRWPSSAGGKGFAPIADKVHSMGLKFGIHVMRGISTQAVSQNTPVLGAKGWTAKDIALTSQPCSWMKDCFQSVNTSTKGGKAFIDSLYQQYASWGVDFIKHDCVFGEDDISVEEVQAVSAAIQSTGRPIVYSLSPGVRATPAMGKLVNNFVNMYRVTSDDWDTWGDLELHFDVARNFASAGLTGAPGLDGANSWPDLDMLPLGWLTDPGVRRGPHRYTSLTPDEQKLQMSLWAIAKSPLIYGGDLQKLDDATLALISNSLMLDINAHSFRNTEISSQASSDNQGTPVLRLLACELAGDTKWSLQNQRLCWSVPKYRNLSTEHITGCMAWRNAAAKSRETTLTTLTGHVQLRSSDRRNLCLSSDGRRPGSYGNIVTSKLSRCSKDHRTRERWEVTADGKLRSQMTGLCAAVSPQVYVSRVWAARGSDGEYYVGLFNLGSRSSKIAISVKTLVSHDKLSIPEDFSKRLSGGGDWECNALEVWSGKNVGVVTDALEAEVPSHGAALYSLTCNPAKK